MYVLFSETITQNRRNGARGGARFRPQPAAAKTARATPATASAARGGAAGDGTRGQPTAGPSVPVARGRLQTPALGLRCRLHLVQPA